MALAIAAAQCSAMVLPSLCVGLFVYFLFVHHVGESQGQLHFVLAVRKGVGIAFNVEFAVKPGDRLLHDDGIAGYGPHIAHGGHRPGLLYGLQQGLGLGCIVLAVLLLVYPLDGAIFFPGVPVLHRAHLSALLIGDHHPVDHILQAGFVAGLGQVVAALQDGPAQGSLFYDAYLVDIPHHGHIDNIPADWAVEMTCTLGRDGATPHPRITHFDDKVMGLIHTIKGFEIAASNAALSGEFNDVLLALNLSPLVHSDRDAELLAREMILAHEKWLPNFADCIAELKKAH